MSWLESEPLFPAPEGEIEIRNDELYEGVSVHELAALRAEELAQALGQAALLRVNLVTHEVTLAEEML